MPSAYSPESRNNASPYPENPFITPQASRNSSVMGSQEKISYKARQGARRVQRYLDNDLRSPYTSLILVICFFTSGIIDAVAFNVWSCFVGMQTANTIFVALGLSGQLLASRPQQYYKSLVSIGSFMLGTLFFNFLHRYPRLSQQPTSRRRLVFILSFIVQTLLIIIAAILVNLGGVSNRPAVSGSFSSGSHVTTTVNTTKNLADLAPIALLAFEAAGPVCLSRVLGGIELPTIVLSTLYHDFTADLYAIAEAWRSSGSIDKFFLKVQGKQGQRAASILALFLGGIVGGEMFKSRAGMSGALFFAAGLKGAICIAWVLWKGEDAAGGFDEEGWSS